ncbi:MAG TPA: efflux RND transporter periplasmic adaptor subunit [Candidatus Sulfotelmatobacter sp.]|nr:efflux RND transporter periplasmic adaptor subunit [Candidatus Sulfotelmatobacter sp.]
MTRLHSLRHAIISLSLAATALTAPILVSPASAQQQGSPPPVTVSAPLKKQVVDYLEYTGQFSAVESVELRARVSGYLTEIHFTDGQMVRKGDLLFVIDPRPYEVALASAKASVQQAEATLELTKRQLARGAELRQKDFLAASDYDSRVQQVKAAEASLDIARASVRNAELDLDYTHITAPVSGRIGAHQVSIGNLVNAGGSGTTGTLLSTLVSLDPIYFNFDVSEGDFLTFQRAVASGQVAPVREGKLAVQLRLSDEKGWPREGVLNFVDNQVDRSSGTIRIRAQIANPDLFVAPGLFGRVRMPASGGYEALVIPEAAVLTDQSDKLVMTVVPDGTVVPKVIKPGPVTDGLMVVRSGLNADDKVVVNGLLRARPGSKVTPQDGAIGAPAAK